MKILGTTSASSFSEFIDVFRTAKQTAVGAINVRKYWHQVDHHVNRRHVSIFLWQLLQKNGQSASCCSCRLSQTRPALLASTWQPFKQCGFGHLAYNDTYNTPDTLCLEHVAVTLRKISLSNSTCPHQTQKFDVRGCRTVWELIYSLGREGSHLQLHWYERMSAILHV